MSKDFVELLAIEDFHAEYADAVQAGDMAIAESVLDKMISRGYEVEAKKLEAEYSFEDPRVDERNEERELQQEYVRASHEWYE